jgi:chromosome partitioning protein
MHVIDIYSPKGGVGKSTISANIASCLASMGHKTALVDLDEQQSALQVYDAEKIGVTTLASVPSQNAGFEYAVLDHHPSHKQKPKGDIVIMPMRANLIDFTSLQRAAANVADKHIKLLVSMLDIRQENQKMYWEKIRKTGGYQVRARNVYMRANDKGVTVFQMANAYAADTARGEILRITNDIKQILQGFENE